MSNGRTDWSKIPRDLDDETMPVNLNFRLPLSLYADLHQVADELDVPVSVVVRSALRAGLSPAASSIEGQIEEHAAGGSSDS